VSASEYELEWRHSLTVPTGGGALSEADNFFRFRSAVQVNRPGKRWERSRAQAIR